MTKILKGGGATLGIQEHTINKDFTGRFSVGDKVAMEPKTGTLFRREWMLLKK